MLCQSERGFPDKESLGPDKRSCSPGQHLHCVRLRVISSHSGAALASLTLGEIMMAPFLWLATAGEEQTNAVAKALKLGEEEEVIEEEEDEEKLGVIPSKPEGALSFHSGSWDAQTGQSWFSVCWEEVMQGAPSVGDTAVVCHQPSE